MQIFFLTLICYNKLFHLYWGCSKCLAGLTVFSAYLRCWWGWCPFSPLWEEWSSRWRWGLRCVSSWINWLSQTPGWYSESLFFPSPRTAPRLLFLGKKQTAIRTNSCCWKETASIYHSLSWRNSREAIESSWKSLWWQNFLTQRTWTGRQACDGRFLLSSAVGVEDVEREIGHASGEAEPRGVTGGRR